MMPVVHPALASLRGEERGFVLGVAVAGGAPGVAARLAAGGDDGDAAGRCRAALEALAAEDAAPRAAALAMLVADAGAPVPAGIARVHPGWIRRALEHEPAAIVRAVAVGMPAPVAAVAEEILAARGDEADAAAAPAALRPGVADQLRRLLLGGLAPMTPEADGVPALARALCELPAGALLEEIDRRGAAVLGASLHGAPASVIAQAAAGVGEPLGREVLAAARGPVTAAARAEARALVASAAREAAALGAARALGLRALARELGGALVMVAQRLPPALGEALLAAGAGAAGA
jgi:hypothetical protein